MFKTTRFMYELGPSLADIGVIGSGNLSGGDSTIESGDGTKPIPSITDATPADEPVEGINPDGSVKDGYQKNEDGTVVKKADPSTPAPVEGLNADGTLQEGYEKLDDGTVQKIADVPADEPDFFEAVEKYSGVKIAVEYPEGVDPVSPEGVAIREKAAMELGATNFEKYIQETNPRAYAFFLHTMNGGQEKDFFEGTNSGYTLPAKETLNDSADAQAAVYKYDLTSRGLDEETADAIVAKAIKDNKLLEKSLASYGTIETAQRKQLEDAQRLAKELEEKEKTDITTLNTRVAKAVSEELSFVVPETERPVFQKFINDNIRYDNGKFYIVQELGNETLKNQLEALLFQYKKGDLSKVIKKQAATQTAQRLRLQANAASGGKSKDAGMGNSQRGNLSLGEVVTR